MQCPFTWYYEKVNQVLPCGHCNVCHQNNALDWAFRLSWEQKVSSSSRFITLTYADEYLPIDYASGEATFDKRDIQLFFKKLRKFNEKSRKRNGKHIRYYLSSEYGGKNGRPHYHIILFNATRETIASIHRLWPIGNVTCYRVSGASIGYVCGYHINSIDDYGTRAKPFALMSRKTGLGINYVKSNALWHRDTNHPSDFKLYVTDNGHKRRMPRFYQGKIFTKDELQENAMTSAERHEIREQKIRELQQFNENPEAYYYKVVQEQHDEIGRRWRAKKQHI